MEKITESVQPAKRRGRKKKMSQGLTKDSKVKIGKKKSRIRKIEPLTDSERKLVEDHLYIADYSAYVAVTRTRGYTGCMSYDDLKSVAYLALCVAAKDFDPNFGVKFATFAIRKTSGYIQHALRDYSRMVKIPRLIMNSRKEVRDLVSKGKTFEEIEKITGLSRDKIVECEESWGEIHVSYDKIVVDGEESGFEIPSYDIDEIDYIGKTVVKELSLLPEDTINLLNDYYYSEDKSVFEDWEVEFCKTFFKLYRSRLNRGVS